MSPLLTGLTILLIPAALLPVLTAAVLWRHRRTPSAVLRERRHIAIVLALLGLIVAFLAVNRLLSWGIGGEILSFPFIVAMLAVDMVSGKWLWDYMRGNFDERPYGPETPIQKEDRVVGDTRRKLQAKNHSDPP